MRKLTFKNDEKHRAIFRIIHSGFLMGVPEEGLRGIDKNRLAMKILDKLETLAKKDSEYKPGESRSITPTGEFILDLAKAGEVKLEEAEFRMVLQHINYCPWVPSASRQVVEAVDFLEKSKEE